MENMLVDARYQSTVIPGTLQANFAPLAEMIDKQMESLDDIEATDENLKMVKDTLAFLRKFKTSMNASLKDDIAKYDKPVEAYKISFNSMMMSVDDVIKRFAFEVDGIVSKQKSAKKVEVQGYIVEAIESLPTETQDLILGCSWFYDDSWSNKSTTVPSIKKEIAKRVSDVWAALQLLDDKSKYASYMLSQYRATGDLMGCLDVKNSLMKQDEEYAGPAIPQTTPAEEPEKIPIQGVPVEISDALLFYNYEIAMTVPEDFLELVREYVTSNGFSFTVLTKGVTI
jgi:hypothetical protein